jgi:prepilin-type N-terminal cleavage/methylation domain-containing protein
MIRLRANTARSAFTLVELLVVMAVIIVLASITAVVMSNVYDQDRTTDGAALTRQYLMLAKAQAARDQLPCGVRLIYGLDATKPQKTSVYWATELQYIQSSPMLLLNPNEVGEPSFPYVRFEYGTTSGGITGRNCFLMNLPPAVQSQMVADINAQQYPLIRLPLYDNDLRQCWLRITNITGPITSPPYPPNLAGPANWILSLDPTYYPPTGFPDDSLGAQTSVSVYHWGLWGGPQPLPGEPTRQLPTNICIDLTPANAGVTDAPSFPSAPFPLTGPGYDILFGSNGQVMNGLNTGGTGQIMLWLRDYTKAPAPLVIVAPGPTNTYDMTPFLKGGEQQIVCIKARSGALGQFPVRQPNPGGQYGPFVNANPGAYTFAFQGATAPGQ